MELNEKNERDPLAFAVLGAAIEVHKILGPGLLESAYEECLAYEFTERGIAFRRQLVMPVVYKKLRLKNAYRLDFLVHDAADKTNALIVEIKAIDRTMEIHEAQLLTYLRMTSVPRGLLINFQVPLLKLGIRRLVV